MKHDCIILDGREVEVLPGQTLLEAARQIGLDIPTLCHLERCGPLTTCLVCLVKVTVHGQSRMVPSCGTLAQPGMTVESETSEVHEARRTALELIFSDHVGDCLSPCHRICPLRMNIPRMLRHVQAGEMEDAMAVVREALPLPAVLGRLCHHPCENGCRRADFDQPAAIRAMERFVADHEQSRPDPVLPVRRPDTGKSVAIVGAGPTGLAAAYALRREGHACTVYDRRAEAGGSLWGTDERVLPRAVLRREQQAFERMGVQFRFGVNLGQAFGVADLLREHAAVLLAVGEVEKGEGGGLWVDLAAGGIKVDAGTCQTSQARVFAAGSAVKPVKQLLRAMAEGQAAAECVHRFVSGQKPRRADRLFSSVMGRLAEGEIKLFMAGVPTAGRLAEPGPEAALAVNAAQASAESSRCLHCDCRASGHCALQTHAERYGVDPNRYRSAERRRFEQEDRGGKVLFESGKCILCGICVKLAEQARAPLGLTLVGRGFDTRLAAPFGAPVGEGMGPAARECVAHCPTGALVFRKGKA